MKYAYMLILHMAGLHRCVCNGKKKRQVRYL